MLQIYKFRNLSLQGNFFGGQKKVSESNHKKRSAQTSPGLNHRSISSSFTSDWRTREDHTSTSPRLGSTVKQLTPSDLQNPVITNSNKTESYPSFQLKRNLGTHNGKVWEVWLDPYNTVRYMSFMAAMVCLSFATFKLTGVRFRGPKKASIWVHSEQRMNTGSLSHGIWGSAFSKGNLIADSLRKLLVMQKKKVNSGYEVGGLEDSRSVASLVSSMEVEEAETLVKQWQMIKAEALGPNYQVCNLDDVLDESMLLQVSNVLLNYI